MVLLERTKKGEKSDIRSTKVAYKHECYAFRVAYRRPRTVANLVAERLYYYDFKRSNARGHRRQWTLTRHMRVGFRFQIRFKRVHISNSVITKFKWKLQVYFSMRYIYNDIEADKIRQAFGSFTRKTAYRVFSRVMILLRFKFFRAGHRYVRDDSNLNLQASWQCVRRCQYYNTVWHSVSKQDRAIGPNINSQELRRKIFGCIYYTLPISVMLPQIPSNPGWN